jgi:hypothetical protein
MGCKLLSSKKFLLEIGVVQLCCNEVAGSDVQVLFGLQLCHSSHFACTKPGASSSVKIGCRYLRRGEHMLCGCSL